MYNVYVICILYRIEYSLHGRFTGILTPIKYIDILYTVYTLRINSLKKIYELKLA